MRSIPIMAIAAAEIMRAAVALAQAPAAVVEDVTGSAIDVEFMDYVDTGKVIRLGNDGSVVLGYLNSCWRESIRGGIVTVGAEQSDVQNGTVERAKVNCHAGMMRLTAEQASKSGVMVVREPPLLRQQPTGPRPQYWLFGLSPIVEVKESGTLVIERIDQPGERYEVPISGEHVLRSPFYDFASANRALAAGGTYRASIGAQEIVFKVDHFAEPGRAPIVSRLLRFTPGS